MLTWIRQLRRSCRPVAGSVVLAFVLLTLSASAPHGHGVVTSSAGRGLSSVAEEAAAALSAVPVCVLCDWLVMPAAVSAPPVLLLIVALGALPALWLAAQARCALPAPRRCPRAPPA